jgi:hypothetical protein
MRTNKPRGFVLERVENVVGVGMPDVYVQAPAVSTWVELKAPNPPKRESTRVLGDEGLRQDQKNWHVRASRLALPTWILIRERRVGRMWMLPGVLADLMNDYTAMELSRVAAAQTWEEIFEVLER